MCNDGIVLDLGILVEIVERSIEDCRVDSISIELNKENSTLRMISSS